MPATAVRADVARMARSYKGPIPQPSSSSW